MGHHEPYSDNFVLRKEFSTSGIPRHFRYGSCRAMNKTEAGEHHACAKLYVAIGGSLKAPSLRQVHRGWRRRTAVGDNHHCRDLIICFTKKFVELILIVGFLAAFGRFALYASSQVGFKSAIRQVLGLEKPRVVLSPFELLYHARKPACQSMKVKLCQHAT